MSNEYEKQVSESVGELISEEFERDARRYDRAFTEEEEARLI